MPPLELLDALFATVAHRMKPMPFRDGAATARYLNNLAYEMPPGMERQRILKLSEVVWGRVFQFAEFRTASKEEVITLLQGLSNTHLVNFDMPTLIESVRSAPAPKPFQPRPILASPTMAKTLNRRSKLSDDLTERIYAGYWALKFGKVAKARQYVAMALERAGIPRGGRSDGETWTTYDVGERLKQYEARAKSTPARRDAHRRWLVEKWQMLCAGVRAANQP